MKDDAWRKCDVCGQYIALKAFAYGGYGKRRLVSPDSAFTSEEWETLCPKCAEKETA